MIDQGFIEEQVSRHEVEWLFDQAGTWVLENHDRRLVHRACRQVLGRLLEGCEEAVPEATTRCRWCGMEANYVSRRPGYVSTCFGAVRYRRAHYVCPSCYHCTYPLDERLNPTASLARLRDRLAAGVPLPVGEIAQSWRLGTVDISLVERITGLQPRCRAGLRNDLLQRCLEPAVVL